MLIFNGASNVVGIAASGPAAFVMLHNDGTVQGWNVDVPAGLSNVVAVSAGLALKIRDDITRLSETVNHMRSLRKQLNERNELLKDDPKAEALIMRMEQARHYRVAI